MTRISTGRLVLIAIASLFIGGLLGVFVANALQAALPGIPHFLSGFMIFGAVFFVWRWLLRRERRAKELGRPRGS